MTPTQYVTLAYVAALVPLTAYAVALWRGCRAARRRGEHGR